MVVSQNTAYELVLEDFRQRFNAHPRAQKLTQGWHRIILLEATDTGSRWALVVKDQSIAEVTRPDENVESEENLVHLQAIEEVLKDIFSGKYNPATALVDGALAVFSSDKDKVKLEALAMVIWRIG
jgi:hypothetical protein